MKTALSTPPPALISGGGGSRGRIPGFVSTVAGLCYHPRLQYAEDYRLCYPFWNASSIALIRSDTGPGSGGQNDPIMVVANDDPPTHSQVAYANILPRDSVPLLSSVNLRTGLVSIEA